MQNHCSVRGATVNPQPEAYMFSSFRPYFIVLLTLTVFISACDSTPEMPPATVAPPTVGPIANAIQISVIYAPECERYMRQAITDLNQAYANGLYPLTGKALTADERPIYITGKDGSSGVVMQGIVNAVLAPNNAIV